MGGSKSARMLFIPKGLNDGSDSTELAEVLARSALTLPDRESVRRERYEGLVPTAAP